MRRALFIYNPISGSRLVPKELDTIVEHFQKQGIYLELFRLEENSEKMLIEAMKRPGLDMIIGAGGDGTIGNIADRLYREGIHLPYGTLGTGTCNNFTHNIDMPEEIEKTIRIIGKGETIHVDMGIVNDEKTFLSSFACGAFAGVSFETDSGSKQILGPFAYYMKALSELKNIKAYPVKINTREETIEEKVYLILVLNGKSVGNFKQVFEEGEVDISDGLMEMILVKESTPLELANSLVGFMKEQKYEGLSNVDVICSDYFYIEGDSTMSVSLDGEKGIPLPVKIEVIKKQLEVFRP